MEYYEQALPLLRAVGDRGGEATTLNNIGAVHSALGEQARALEYYEQALPLLRAVGDRGGEATTLNNIGTVSIALWGSRRAPWSIMSRRCRSFARWATAAGRPLLCSTSHDP